MSNSHNIRLLIIEESSSDAESLANELRNAGHAIDLKFAGDPGAAETLVAECNPEIVICGSGDKLPDPRSIQEILDRQAANIALIAIGDEASEATVADARKAGIAALVSYDRPDHLHSVFRREAIIAGMQRRIDTFNGRLKDVEKRCHALIENSSDAIAYIHEGMHVFANRPYMKLFAIDPDTGVEGIPVLDMISSSHRDRFRDFLKHYHESSNADNTINIDCVSPSGEVLNSDMELAVATMDGEPCTQIIIRVNTGNNIELEQKIRDLSQKDILTGLWNRQHFMRLLENSLGQPPADMQRAVLYLALDNFKTLREEAGIASSDYVLRDIAGLISSHFGEQDLLSRFGDYSFVILTQGADKDGIQASAEVLLRKIAEHLSEIDGRAYTLTASIGICAMTARTNNAQKIISNADMACEVARTSGGNQLHTHSTVVDDTMDQDRDNDWDQMIRETIDEERFYLVYQPIVSLKGDKSQHYEVLLRIVDGEGKVIMPGQFLSIAEKSGLALDIDRWVIEKSIATLAEQDKASRMTFYIKISAMTLADINMVEWIGEKLLDYDVDTNQVVFEIAEQTAADNLRESMDFVVALHMINCRVAIEHFGATDQPMLLKHVPADIIKLDGSLINGMAGDKDMQARVRSISDSARENNKVCMAECVDDAQALAMLWQLNIDFIQGYFVQEPGKELSYEFESEIV